MYSMLSKSGCEVWIDKINLLPGDDWEKEIKLAIKSADIFVAFLTPDYMNSRGYRHVELKIAYDTLKYIPDGEVYVIPIKLHPEAKVPELLNKYQWLNYYEYGAELKLIKAIAKQTNIELISPLPYNSWNKKLEPSDFSEKLTKNVKAILGDLTVYLRETLKSSDSLNQKQISNHLNLILGDNDLDIEISILNDSCHYMIHSNTAFKSFIGQSIEDIWKFSQGVDFTVWLKKKLNENPTGLLLWQDKYSSNRKILNDVSRNQIDGYNRKTVVAFRKVSINETQQLLIMVEGHQSEYK